MKRNSLAVQFKRVVFALALVSVASWAQAADIHVVSSGGFAAAYKALGPGFEKKTGHKLISDWGPSMGETRQAIPNRLARGEQFDVVIMVGDSLDGLVKAGKVSQKDHELLALSRIGLAVKAGAPKPDISSIDALKKTLLAAHSIAYSDSASGVYLSTVLFKRLGVEEQLKGKARMIPAEPVGNVVARGEAELGFQQLSELKPLAGIDIVGPLPEAAQQVTPFSAGIVVGARQPEAARELLDYLASPEAQDIIRQAGLDPAPRHRQ
ncbi:MULTISPECIES: substrate-binding domain-containing protein [unclassified Herbaspirillum]|uniref:substrate-binding domain-containing protein n=1 Tax=unclassified Herbaspirillum TaxID=2624150 RepID=UPI00114EF73A|nr:MULTISPECIES: substrate-binding domain-containing protein [unclassified Herbaspirillum]MBB5390064.1 molybdate transport system substrate-binding protein [Herbaspirillum sp. SJZ102]TQK09435.1 molybdate transport system substrate-binding protein [Herbaspirillum sp. SJZ130]TQK13878.1 molybdate transport system substrate-binding protein [Herbaspirillum sp. SJZ106]TWC69601.1 molybdate transport system substrate-binding protein [Herbaspirillum sp. SJZ099]